MRLLKTGIELTHNPLKLWISHSIFSDSVVPVEISCWIMKYWWLIYSSDNSLVLNCTPIMSLVESAVGDISSCSISCPREVCVFFPLHPCPFVFFSSLPRSAINPPEYSFFGQHAASPAFHMICLSAVRTSPHYAKPGRENTTSDFNLLDSAQQNNYEGYKKLPYFLFQSDKKFVYVPKIIKWY